MVIKMKIEIGGFNFLSDTKYDISMSLTEEKENYKRIKIKMDFGAKITPENVTVKWEYSGKNIISVWHPQAWFDNGIKPVWNPRKNESRSAQSAPVMCHYSQSGHNILTISLTDVRTPIEMSSGVNEGNANIVCALNFFSQRVSAMSEYETELIIDMRDIPYYDAIRSASDVWADIGYKSAYVPDSAMRPMYSTWYAYHQNMKRDELVNELKLAKEYGMETVIVDDGWQTTDCSGGYSTCGDWEPERFPDMKELVQDIHDLGMKYMMWYSVPFVGKDSKIKDRFQGKFLNLLDENMGAYTFDPRFPDVREYLASIYEKAVTDWHLDGLKLDFIDSFKLTEYSAIPDERMDYESLEDGVCALLSEVMEKLRRIKPDIMIEFRQKYIGPIMRTYGNMLRVEDCPLSPLHNRVGSIDLRLTSGTSAVHSDMLMWNYDDTVESAALELINILFCVPQISVLIEKLTDNHKKMLKFYLDFWNEHRDCLMMGELTAKNPESNYSIAWSSTDNELIAVSYTKNVLDITKEYQSLYFVNGSCDDVLIINNKNGEYTGILTVYDCMGNVTKQEKYTVKSGYNAINVPMSGIICINK